MDSKKEIDSFPKQFGNSSKKILLIALGLYVAAALVLYFVDPFFHNHQHLKWVVVKEPTCISEGIEENRCYCGNDTYTRSVPVTDHTFGPWRIDLFPTKTKNGQRSRYCTVCSAPHKVPLKATDPAVHGSAGWVGNNTVVVSIFASDRSTYWDPYSPQDEADKVQMRKLVQITTDWITKQCARYDAYPQFYYDWESDPELVYHYTFKDLDVSRGITRYHTQRQFVLLNIPSKKLLDRYQAQNIIYLFFFNTTEANTSVSTGYFDNIRYYDQEIVNLFTHKKSNYTFRGSNDLSASLMALLMLRCYGAPPLWCENSKITGEYAAYLKETKNKSVMRAYNYGEWIYRTLTQLDAYYLGLTDLTPYDVIEYGLGRSDFAS